MYAADLEGPKCATSNQDPHLRSNKPNKASRKEERKTINPPPKSDRPGQGSDSDYYPPDTTKVVEIPDPLTQNHAYANSNVSSQPRGLGTAPSPHHKAASNTQGLGTEEKGEVEGPNIYLDLNDPSLPPSSEKTPDPRTHTNAKDSQTHTYIKSPVPQGSGTKEEDDEGPNIYLDLNGPSRPSSPETTQAEKIPDPLPRIHTYVNSNISQQPQFSEMSHEDSGSNQMKSKVNINLYLNP
ncbi:hypothetical protein Bbelb_365290 [Branchiostoma belcheri]|nr:hypothetical protein Bbelb_365290 [Branchiostoma belcheri]